MNESWKAITNELIPFEFVAASAIFWNASKYDEIAWIAALKREEKETHYYARYSNEWKPISRELFSLWICFSRWDALPSFTCAKKKQLSANVFSVSTRVINYGATCRKNESVRNCFTFIVITIMWQRVNSE